MSDRTTLAAATAGFDPAFERTLTEAIMTAIAAASIVTDAPVMCLRTSETIGALAACLATTLAMHPDMDVPSRLRIAVDEIAKRIRSDAAKARAQGVGDIFGAAHGGHA